MPINCPQCGTAMAEVNPAEARCARHGIYSILFKRDTADDDGLIPLAQSASAPAAQPRAVLPAPGQQHIPYASPAAQFTPYGAPAGRAPVGPCQNHPQSQAIVRCSRCTAPMCPTCDFVFPGNLHLCPRCVTLKPELSGSRKSMVIAAFILAGVATFAAILVFSGAMTGASILLVGLFIQWVMLDTSIIGMGLAFGAIDRKLGTPVSVWIAAFWNLIIVAIGVLLFIIGIMAGGGR
jgi:hypothetical protein